MQKELFVKLIKTNYNLHLKNILIIKNINWNIIIRERLI